MGNKLFVGLDLSLKDYKVSIIEQDGAKTVKPFSVTNDQYGAKIIIDTILKCCKVLAVDTVFIGLESTSVYGWHIQHLLADSSQLKTFYLYFYIQFFSFALIFYVTLLFKFPNALINFYTTSIPVVSILMLNSFRDLLFLGKINVEFHHHFLNSDYYLISNILHKRKISHLILQQTLLNINPINFFHTFHYIF